MANILLMLMVATTIAGQSDNGVVMINDTDLYIAHMEIDGKKFEGWGAGAHHGIVYVKITPEKHHIKLLFRGGSTADWPELDFKGVHEVFFERKQNKIEARIE